MEVEVELNEIIVVGADFSHESGIVFDHDVLMALGEGEFGFVNIRFVGERGQVILGLSGL